MKYLKNYSLFESVKDPISIIKKLNKNKEAKYYLDNGLVNVLGDVIINNLGLVELPIKFGIVEGIFDCSWNQIESLSGSPMEVDADFRCSNNKISSLNEGPIFVNGDFECSINLLTSLKGGPKIVKGDYSCINEKLIDFTGMPEILEGQFICHSINDKKIPKEIKKIIKNYNHQKISWKEFLNKMKIFELFHNSKLVKINQKTGLFD